MNGHTSTIPLVPWIDCPTCEAKVIGTRGEIQQSFLGRSFPVFCIIFPCECGFRAFMPTTPEGLPVTDLRREIA